MDIVLYKALLSYFKSINIRISPNELKLQLFSHPYTPSLFAVSETLSFLKIDNVAAEVEHEQLELLPDNFIAFLEPNGKEGHFAHVKKSENQIQLDNNKTKISFRDFYDVWNGIILIAEKNDESTSRASINSKSVLFILTVLLIVFFWSKPLVLLYGFLSVFGLILSEEIFKTSNKIDSYLAGKICGKAEKKGCSAVLNDSKYRLFSYSFNDFLFSFFTATLIYTFWTTTFDVVHIFLSVVAVLAVIATIIIQKFVAKTWCALCLFSSLCIAVQTVLVFTSSASFAMEIPSNTASTWVLNFVFFTFLFVLSLLLVSQNRALREKSYKMTAEIIGLLRFKRSPKVVSQVLSLGKIISTFDGFTPLKDENNHEEHVIRLVLSTACGFCKDSFNHFHDHYLKNKGKYSYQIVFNHFEDYDSQSNLVAASLIQIYQNKGFDGLLEGLDRWFNKPATAAFLGQYEWKAEDENVSVLLQQRDWCQRNKLFHTPILIIDEHVISEHYDASFIEDLLGQM